MTRMTARTAAAVAAALILPACEDAARPLGPSRPRASLDIQSSAGTVIAFVQLAGPVGHVLAERHGHAAARAATRRQLHLLVRADDVHVRRSYVHRRPGDRVVRMESGQAAGRHRHRRHHHLRLQAQRLVRRHPHRAGRGGESRQAHADDHRGEIGRGAARHARTAVAFSGPFVGGVAYCATPNARPQATSALRYE